MLLVLCCVGSDESIDQEKEECEEQLKQSAIAAKEEEKRLLVERDLEIKKHQDRICVVSQLPIQDDTSLWMKDTRQSLLEDLLAFVQHRFEVVREKRGEACGERNTPGWRVGGGCRLFGGCGTLMPGPRPRRHASKACRLGSLGTAEEGGASAVFNMER